MSEWARGWVTDSDPLTVTFDGRQTLPAVSVGTGTFLPGEPVMLLNTLGELHCFGVIHGSPLPQTVTVTATSVAGKPGYLQAGARELQYLASYAPSVGDVVQVLWQGSQGLVLGVAPTQSGTAPPVPTPGGITSGVMDFPARDAGSWEGYWGQTDVSQGSWGSYGPYYGAWFYSNEPYQALNDATVQAAYIYVHRKAGAGVSGQQTMHFYHHTSDYRPATDVARDLGPYDVLGWDRGAEGWLQIPNALATAVITTGGGIGIAGNPYVRTDQTNPMNGAIRIYWQRGA